MLRRTLPCLLCSALLLLAVPAAADVALPNTHIIPSESVFTGLRDFPAYRFVVAVSTHRPDPKETGYPPIPPPAPVREGEPVDTGTTYFQDLRAIPADTPDPVSDAWVLASKSPTSGSFSRHPRHVPDDSTEKVARGYFHVRQIHAGWISLELLKYVAVMPDGSEQPIVKVLPVSYSIQSLEAPPGWQLFLMPNPSWPRADPPLPALPCKAGDVLPLVPGPRTLVAVKGALEPDGSPGDKPFVLWPGHLDPWYRAEASLDSPVVALRTSYEVVVRPGDSLDMIAETQYQDGKGRWFHDEGMTLPVEVPGGWEVWAAAAGGLGAVALAGGWVWRRRRRTRA